MKLRNKILRRFGKDTSGVAAVEFAFIAPVMVAMFFGMVEISDAMKAHKKVSSAANILADLTSQQKRLSHAEAADIFIAVEQVIAPYGIDDAEMELVSVVLDEEGNPVVAWSTNNQGGTPYSNGAAFNEVDLPSDHVNTGGNQSLSSFIDANGSLVFSKVKYKFTSKLSKVTIDQLEFEQKAFRWPRDTAKVKYCSNSEQLDTCISDIPRDS